MIQKKNKPYIKKRYMGIALFMIIPAVITMAILIVTFFYSYVKQVELYGYEQVITYRSTVESAMNGMMSKAVQFSQDEYVADLFDTEKKDLEGGAKNESFLKLYDEIVSQRLFNLYISSVYFYVEKTGYVFGTSNSGYIDDVIDKSWYDSYSHNNFDIYFETRKGPAGKAYLTLIYRYENKGAIVINCDFAEINKNHRADTGKYYVVSGDDNVILSSNAEDVGARLDMDDCLKISRPLSYMDWKCVFIANTLGTTQIRNSVIRNVIICIVLIIVAWFFVSYFIAGYIYKGFIQVADVFRDYGEYAGTPGKNYIGRYIDAILNQQSAMEEEIEKKIAIIKQTQMTALQMQINPHFLMNTLNAINMVQMQLLKGDNDASKMTILMSELLRNALNSENIVVTLEEEIQGAKKYLEIQRIRYKNSFDVFWQVDEGVCEARLPKMTLQPLIENFFTHGMKGLQTRGVLNILISAKKKKLKIHIIDNGNKIPDERLTEIKERLKKVETISHRNIGLSNVNQRIKLLFGEEYGCDINSGVIGTCIEVIVPFVKEDIF